MRKERSAQMPGSEDFLKKIEKQGLILFGTGYLAGVWLEILQAHGLEHALQYCLVSQCDPDASFEGHPVYSLKNAPFPAGRPAERMPVLGLAVHETVAEEVLPQLQIHYPGDCELLYPRMHELAFGPVLRQEAAALSVLLSAQPEENFWISLRYAALCEHMAGRESTDRTRRFSEIRAACAGCLAADIYLKSQSLFSARETAALRLERFFALADAPEKERILRENPIMADEKLRIIDGLHRIALAVYLGLETLPCRIVRTGALYDRLFTEKNRLTPAAQIRAGLSAQERKMLQLIRKELLNG